jgi:hypothetical protein
LQHLLEACVIDRLDEVEIESHIFRLDPVLRRASAVDR